MWITYWVAVLLWQILRTSRVMTRLQVLELLKTFNQSVPHKYWDHIMTSQPLLWKVLLWDFNIYTDRFQLLVAQILSWWTNIHGCYGSLMLPSLQIAKLLQKKRKRFKNIRTYRLSWHPYGKWSVHEVISLVIGGLGCVTNSMLGAYLQRPTINNFCMLKWTAVLSSSYITSIFVIHRYHIMINWSGWYGKPW